MLAGMAKEQQWLERVLAWRASGQSAIAFCEDKTFKASALRGWSARLGREGKVPRSHLGPVRPQKPQAGEVAFARVVRTQDTVDSQTSQSVDSLQPMVVTVGRSHIALSPGFDAALLRSVVQALAEIKS